MQQAAFIFMTCAWLRTDTQGAIKKKEYLVQQLLGLGAHAGSQDGLRLGIGARRIQPSSLLRLHPRQGGFQNVPCDALQPISLTRKRGCSSVVLNKAIAR